jgi:DNA-binding CsgD family transcriptional regulator
MGYEGATKRMASRYEKGEASLRFLEAAYAWEREDGPWLQGVVDAAVEAWGAVVWGFAAIYDASDIHRLRTHGTAFAAGRPPPQPFLRRLQALPPEFVARTYRGKRSGFTRKLGAHQPPMYEELEDFGSSDIFALNGADAEGVGCGVALGTASSRISFQDERMLQRLAIHLTSAYRCRRRLKDQVALDAAEAILDPNGRLLEARGPARTAAARASLCQAVTSIESLRARKVFDEELAGWPPRVQTRWTLVDAFSKDGTRYVVARENLAWAEGLEALTERERQVVASAAAGKRNKEIAYELGVAHSTARVLLARACARLGVRSRENLLALPCVRALKTDPE